MSMPINLHYHGMCSKCLPSAHSYLNTACHSSVDVSVRLVQCGTKSLAGASTIYCAETTSSDGTQKRNKVKIN